MAASWILFRFLKVRSGINQQWVGTAQNKLVKETERVKVKERSHGWTLDSDKLSLLFLQACFSDLPPSSCVNEA